MAQVWTTKQQNWLNRFSNAVVGMLANADAINELCAEFTDNQFGTGGTNAIADATVQAAGGQFAGLPACTAAFVNSAVGVFANNGGLNSLISSSGSNRPTLENMRP